MNNRFIETFCSKRSSCSECNNRFIYSGYKSFNNNITNETPEESLTMRAALHKAGIGIAVKSKRKN